MLENFIYENHLGQRFVGLDVGVYLNSSELRNYSWKHDTVNSRISRFYRPITDRKIPLVVCGYSAEEAMTAMNRLTKLAETDVVAKIPGKIFVGDYYTNGYITSSRKTNYLLDERLCEIELVLRSDDPAWYLETTYAFHVGGGVSGGNDGNDDGNSGDEPGGIVPTGTITVTANGQYDVTRYATVDVNVEQPEREITVSHDGNGNVILNGVTATDDGSGNITVS
jgi:hypothetical protein